MASGSSGIKAEHRFWREKYFWLLLGLLSFAAVIYFAIFLPMTQRVITLTNSINETKKTLLDAGISDLERSHGLDKKVASELVKLGELSERINQRMQFHPNPDEILTAPFRLLEFEQRRFTLFRELLNQAEHSAVELPQRLLSMLPSYSSEERFPARLALRLEFVAYVLNALLMHAGALELVDMEVLPERIFEMELDVEAVLEFRLRLRIHGHVDSLIPFLAGSNPSGEAGSAAKGYFIEHLLLDNSKGDDAGITQLEVQLSGFVKTFAGEGW